MSRRTGRRGLIARTGLSRTGLSLTGLSLTGIGLTCALVLALVNDVTADRIRANRAAQAAATLLALTGLDALPSGTWRDDRWPLCDGTLLLRGSAAGYGGPIDWLLAATPMGTEPDARPALRIRALRITAHRETPGIADFLDAPEQGWLATFRGRDANGPMPDGLTGATVTTRALTLSIAGALAGAGADQAAECAQP
jgi:electron transport complex protein RnfG